MGEDTTNFAMQCELRYYWELHVCHEGVFTPFIKMVTVLVTICMWFYFSYILGHILSLKMFINFLFVLPLVFAVILRCFSLTLFK